MFRAFAADDGQWRYIEVDLEAKMQAIHGDVERIEFDGIEFRGNDYLIDDIIVSGTTMTQTFQTIPGAPIMSYLGAEDASGDRWYYHYNDLGTVLATTEETGDKIGVYTRDPSIEM